MGEGFSLAEALEAALADKSMKGYPTVTQDITYELPVMLKAEVLVTGKGCPVCGEEKTKRAKTCLTCFRKLGPKGTHSVNAVAEAIAQAVEGHQAAISTRNPFPRDVVWGPVLAQIRVDKNAICHIPQNGITSYLDCDKSVPGGFISLYVFGANENQKGMTITGLVELKIKEHRPGKRIHYLRAQAVAGVTSNVRLVICAPENVISYIDDLPQIAIQEQRRRYSIGFLPDKA